MRKVDQRCIYDKSGNYWLRKDSNDYIFGITDWGQYLLGKITSLSEVADSGRLLIKDQQLALLESNKASNEILMPIDATVIDYNKLLPANPELINIDCYGEGWLVKMKLTNPNELELWDTPEDYRKAIDGLFRKKG